MRIAKRRLQLFLFLISIPIAAAVVSRSHIADRLWHASPLQLKVDLSERRMSVIEGGDVVQTYPVAVGSPSHPTPTGSFSTGRIVWNPGWNPPDSEWAEGLSPRAPGDPANPMQGVKIYFREPAYFIHGTNNPSSIGQAVSHGCIRMTTSSAKSVANLIEEHGGGVPLVIQP